MQSHEIVVMVEFLAIIMKPDVKEELIFIADQSNNFPPLKRHLTLLILYFSNFHFKIDIWAIKTVRIVTSRHVFILFPLDFSFASKEKYQEFYQNGLDQH